MKKIKFLIGTIIVGIFLSMTYLLSLIGSSDSIFEKKNCPKLSINVSKTTFESSEKIRINYSIKYDRNLFINYCDKRNLIVRKRKDTIVISQYFDEKTLKNIEKNPFINNGTIPGVKRIGNIYDDTIAIQLDKVGTYEIMFCMGYNEKSRENFIVYGADYNFTELIDRFLQWQKYVESNRITISIVPDSKERRKKLEQERKMKYRAAMSLNNLANSYIKDGKYAEAEKILKKSLYMIESNFGRKNDEYALVLYNLGILFFYAKKEMEAEKYFNDALIIFEKCHGPTYLKTIETKFNLAKFYLKIGEKDKFRRVLKEQISIIKREKTSSVELLKLGEEMENFLLKYGKDR